MPESDRTSPAHSATVAEHEPWPRQNVAVLQSETTRRAYIAEARTRSETYTFTGADGRSREWLKGQYAYLAPNAAVTLLNRLNLKHDLVTETDVATGGLDAYRLLLVPNAGALDQTVIASIQNWLTAPGADGRRLIVTGRTNLPPELFGLASAKLDSPQGYTGWRFSPDSPFADQDIWERQYLTSYRGYAAMQAVAGPAGHVLASLWEIPNPQADEAATRIGDAIVRTERTLFVANQVLEFMGGTIQAHLNVDEIRDHPFPTHYMDTIGYLIRQLMSLIDLDGLFETQLRAFGTYSGMVVLRHDADVPRHETIDLSLVRWQQQNQIPATYVVLDPDVSPDQTDEADSRAWIEAATRTNLLEVGLHNDGHAGSPPTYVTGRALADHVLAGDQRLGITSATIGRHYGFHYHPETLDAMEYLYDRAPSLIGMCTFSVLQVIEYGVQDPDVTWLGRPITYSTRYRTQEWTSGAVTGWWFPHHVVTTDTEGARTLRGWDSTKESEADYDRIDELLAGNNTRQLNHASRLPNPVLTVQYHSQNAHSPQVNHGQGSLAWVQYLCSAAIRNGFGIASKRAVYTRLSDYEQTVFRVEADGSVLVANPGDRQISGLMVRLPGPVSAVMSGGEACIHIVDGTTFTLPELGPGQRRRFISEPERVDLPLIKQPNSRQLELLSAVHDPGSRETVVTARASGRSNLVIERAPWARSEVVIASLEETQPRYLEARSGRLVIPICAPEQAEAGLRIVVRDPS